MTGVQNYYSDYCSLLYEFVYVCRVYVLNSKCMCAFVVFSCKLTDCHALKIHFQHNCFHTMHFIHKPTQLTTSNKTPTPTAHSSQVANSL